MNFYAGKEVVQREGRLGERVVTKLCSTIRKNEVTLIFDRFFTLVKLFDTVSYPAVETLIKTRKHVPVFKKDLGKHYTKFIGSNQGTLGVQWQDTKTVCAASNCYRTVETFIGRKEKTGEKVHVR